MEPHSHRCAGGIVLGDSGTVAMIKNQKATLWFFPKGKLEPGEDDEAAARREIEEEAGLSDLELIDDLGSYERPRINADGSYKYDEVKSIHMFLFAAPMHAEIAADNEIEEARWVPLKQVIDSLQDAKDRAWFTTVFERVRHAIQRD